MSFSAISQDQDMVVFYLFLLKYSAYLISLYRMHKCHSVVILSQTFLNGKGISPFPSFTVLF